MAADSLGVPITTVNEPGLKMGTDGTISEMKYVFDNQEYERLRLRLDSILEKHGVSKEAYLNKRPAVLVEPKPKGLAAMMGVRDEASAWCGVRSKT